MRCWRRLLSYFEAFFIARVEELFVRVELVHDGRAAVFAHVEHFCFDTDPVKVARELSWYVSFASGGQTDLKNRELVDWGTRV